VLRDAGTPDAQKGVSKVDMSIIRIKLKIIVEKDDDAFHAYCPDLKGLHAGGDTEEEALSNAVNGAQLYLASLLKHQEPIPVGVIDGEPWSARQWLHGLVSRLSSSSYVREVQLPVPA